MDDILPRLVAESLPKNFRTRCRGLYMKNMTLKDLRWADRVIVFEEEDISRLEYYFPAEEFKERTSSLGVIVEAEYEEIIEGLRRCLWLWEKS